MLRRSRCGQIQRWQDLVEQVQTELKEVTPWAKAQGVTTSVHLLFRTYPQQRMPILERLHRCTCRYR